MLDRITLYKIKPSVLTFEGFIKREDAKGRPLPPLLDLNVPEIEGLQVRAGAAFKDSFSAQKTENDIPWLAFINAGLEPDDKLRFHSANKFPSAVVALAIKEEDDENESFFALTFGLGGDTFLNHDAVVKDFGIRVAMNVCDTAKLKRVQTSIHEAISTQSEKQISVGSTFSVFNIDDDKEFLRSISGSAKDDYDFIGSLTGRDNVSIKLSSEASLDWENIFSRASQIDKAYSDTSYQETFKGYDKFHFENDPDTITALDDLLFAEIIKDNPSNVHLAAPEFVDYDAVYFTYVSDSDELPFSDLDLYELKQFKRFNVRSSIKSLKNSKVELRLSETGSLIKTWSIYKCLVAEIRYGDDTYVLSMGQWKKISRTFVQEVQTYMNGIDTTNLDFMLQGVNIWDPDAKKDKHGIPKGENREDVYNRALSDSSEDIILFDKAKIEIAGQRRYEVCDLLHRDKYFIHVKKMTSGSASISHLFLQGRFYTDAFLSDKNCREGMRQFIKDEVAAPRADAFIQIVPEDRSEIIANSYTVVFCVLSDEELSLGELPFMAQYELMYTHRHLCSALGLQCRVALRAVVLGPPQ